MPSASVLKYGSSLDSSARTCPASSRYALTTLSDSSDRRTRAKKGMISSCQSMPATSTVQLAYGSDALLWYTYGLPVLTPRPRWSAMTLMHQPAHMSS